MSNQDNSLQVFCIGTADTKLDEFRFLSESVHSNLRTFSTSSSLKLMRNVVNLVNKEEVHNHPDKTLILDCKKLMEDMRIELVHVLREGNKCADYLSKLGRTQGEQLMRVMVPSNELVQLLKADMQGVAYQRGD